MGLFGNKKQGGHAAESEATVSPPDAPAPAPAAPQPPPLAHSLSSQLTANGQLNDDAIEEMLEKADVPMLCKRKGVSRNWRARGVARGE